MPAPFDLFSTAVMLKAVEQMPRIYTFLSDSFAADGGLVEDDRAMYDYRRGAEKGLAEGAKTLMQLMPWPSTARATKCARSPSAPLRRSAS